MTTAWLARNSFNGPILFISSHWMTVERVRTADPARTAVRRESVSDVRSRRAGGIARRVGHPPAIPWPSSWLEFPDFHVPEPDLRCLDFERDPAAGHGSRPVRVLGVNQSDVLPLVDHLAVQDMDGTVTRGDDLGRVPAVDLEIAGQPLLVADALPAEHAGNASGLRVQV